MSGFMASSKSMESGFVANSPLNPADSKISMSAMEPAKAMTGMFFRLPASKILPVIFPIRL